MRDAIQSMINKERMIETADLEHIKATHGTTAYLEMLEKCSEKVQFPSDWTCMKDGELKCVPLIPMSKAYTEVAQLLTETWHQGNVGQGYDAFGLKHQKINITKISRIENPTVYRKYANYRSTFCFQAASNSYPSVNGFRVEQDVRTKTLKGTSHGMDSNLYC